MVKGFNVIDIEYLLVDNDLRKWSDRKKWIVLMIMIFVMVSICK